MPVLISIEVESVPRTTPNFSSCWEKKRDQDYRLLETLIIYLHYQLSNFIVLKISKNFLLYKQLEVKNNHMSTLTLRSSPSPHERATSPFNRLLSTRSQSDILVPKPVKANLEFASPIKAHTSVFA